MANNERLVALIQSGRNQKKNLQRLYDQNQGLICKAANLLYGTAEEDDLKQEGYLAMHDAAMSYDPGRGMSFASYAFDRMKWRMLRYVAGNRTVHVPERVQQMIRRYNKAWEALTHRLGREPSDDEIRAFVGLTQRQYDNVIKALSVGNLGSLDEPLNEEDGDCLYELVSTAEDVAERVTEEAAAADLRKTLWEAVDRLPARQAFIIKERYQKGRRLIDVSADFEELGFTDGQTREIERAGLKNLRSYKYRRLYGRYLPDYYQARAYRGNGVGYFKRTWTSSTEKVALQKVEHDAERILSLMADKEARAKHGEESAEEGSERGAGACSDPAGIRV